MNIQKFKDIQDICFQEMMNSPAFKKLSRSNQYKVCVMIGIYEQRMEIHCDLPTI